MSTQPDITRVGGLITFIILFYDYLLTFPAEVRYFWRRPCFNLGRVLFFAVRYLALCFHSLSVTQSFMKAKPGNDPIGLMIVQLFSTAIMTMRVYAFYEKNRLVLGSLWLVAVAILGFSFWILFPDSPWMEHSTVIMSCTTYIDASTSRNMALAWGGKFVFDALVFGLTVCRSCRIGRVGDHSLVDILLRDGAIYFAIISVAHVTSVVILMLGSAPYRAITGLVSDSLTAIMVTRLALNLQEPRLARRRDTNLMTTAIELEDLPSSVDIDDSDLCSARRRGEVAV